MVPATRECESIKSVRGIRIRPYHERTFADAANDCVRQSAADVVLCVAPLARIHPELPGAYARPLADPATSLVYGTYRVHGASTRRVALVEPVADRDDLSEWSATGYVQAVRRDTWLRCEGYDASLRHAQEYDLRLRFGECGDFVYIDRPFYDVEVPSAPTARTAWQRAASHYFTPESSEVPGFAYLMMDKTIEEEVDRVFKASLQRRGALLTGPYEPLTCPHEDASPKVSVIVATRNRRHFLAEAIQSVLGGRFQDFEVIVVDNGSSDGSDRLLADLMRMDGRIRVHPDRSEKSIAVAHNLAVAAARGKYVSQLDSDDTYTPETLLCQVDALERNPRWALAISYYELVNSRGEGLSPLGIVKHTEYDRNTILRTSGAGAVRTWHRCVIEGLGGFDAERCGYYAEDYDLVLRAGERWEVGRVHEVLYRCRLHEANNETRISPRERAEIKTGVRRRALRRRIRAGERLTRAGD